MIQYHEPIRGKGMRRMLKRHKLKVVLIDEYRTSKTKGCIAWVTQNSSRKAHEPEWVADGRYWNRDTAAVLNFRHMVRSLIATRTVPNPFRRNGGGTPGANDDTPATNDDTPATNDDTPATNDDTPAAGNGTGSDDDDVAAQAQHRYQTRRRTGRAPADNAQQQ
ncbi:hypothetical protein LPJ81_005309 [Coemansia sp. IMI 209127]|nr:hypothetical protein LPJ81_005309 [Coemansia sp. IMI 209127]